MADVCPRMRQSFGDRFCPDCGYGICQVLSPASVAPPPPRKLWRWVEFAVIGGLFAAGLLSAVLVALHG